MDNKHKKIKLMLKILGITLMVIGLGFTILGFADFFVSFNKEEMPVYFWAFYIGLPFLGIGITTTTLGFRKEITNYMKNETIDTQKEIIQDITPEVSNLVKESTTSKVECPKCKTLNDTDDKYCKKCGEPLCKTCPYCNAKLDPDSEYCDKCGKKLD